jgi:hypothetical protein
MNKMFAVMAGGLLVATPLVMAPAASAQVTAVVTGGSTTVVLGNGTTTETSHNARYQVGDSNANQAGQYQVVSDLTPDNIVFANSVATEGSFASVTSSTSLAITYENSGLTPITPQLESTITPGGFGFYAAANQDPMGTSIANIENSPSTTAPFTAFGTNAPFLAGASFSVNIASNGVTVASYSGTLTLTPAVEDQGMNNHGPIVTLTLGGLATTLNNFRLLTPSGSLTEVGYQWDATDQVLTIPGGALAPGESRTLTYDTTVTAFTNGAGVLCGGVYQCAQLFAFSGFGDPIGRGGGGVPPALRSPLDGGMDPSGISDVYFPQFQFGLPTFDPLTGNLSLPLSPDELPALPFRYFPAQVPEPETWMLMLVGLGGAGLALRRRARPRTA